MQDCYIGASIAVNGVCLTVTEMDTEKRSLSFGISPETIRRANFCSASGIQAGGRANLERAARLDARVSGHYVQGHVDGTAKIISKTRDGESLWIKLGMSNEMMSGVVEKGFVAIDGTSLTVCEVDRNNQWFSFMLIPHTQSKVTIPLKDVGDLVNIELDVMNKFVAQSVENMEHRLVAKFESVFERLSVLEENVRQLQNSK